MRPVCLLWICALLSLANLGHAQKHFIHCLESDKPLQLPDPFPISEEDDDFVILSWTFCQVNESCAEQDTKTLLEYALGTHTLKEPARWKLYQHWGLQLDDPTFDDSGIYTASLAKTSEIRPKHVVTSIIVAKSPELKSSKLDVSRKVSSETGEVTLTCGTLASLGTPPVDVIWRAPNGSALDGVYKDGNSSLVLSKEESDGTFLCELQEPAPAVTCISANDLPRWEGKYAFSSTAGSPESSIIMVIVIVCAVVLLVITIIVIVVLVKKKSSGEAYNTKDEEAKADNGHQGGEGGGGESLRPLMAIQDDANPYDRPNPNTAAKYPPSNTGRHTASPYMVSGLNLTQEERGQLELPPKKKKAPVAATESTDSIDGDKSNGKTKGRYTKRGDAKDTGGGDKGQGDSREPPTPKKRSIFLTDSNEALNKIAEAVAGGKGSGAGGERTAESQV